MVRGGRGVFTVPEVGGGIVMWLAFILALAAVSAYRPLLIHWLATRRCPDVDYGDSRPCVAQCYWCEPGARYRRFDEVIDEDYQ